MLAQVDAEKGLVPVSPSAVVVKDDIATTEKSKFREQVQTAANDDSIGSCTFCCIACGILFGTIWWQIFYALLTIIPICMVYFGAANLYNCTVSNFIPIYLLVGGICLLLDQILHWLKCRGKKSNQDESAPSAKDHVTVVGSVFDTFTGLWLFIGSFWVYKIYTPNYDLDLGEYCDRTMYLFAFWIITAVYILVILGTLIGCCMCCFIIRSAKNEIDKDLVEQENETNTTNPI